MCLVQTTLASIALLIAAPDAAPEAVDPTFAAAERRLATGDFDGAIALFETGLALLPADPGYAPARAEVLLTIVTAHEAAFDRDRDVERLLRARSLLDHYLGPLDLLDEQGRAAAEDRRVALIARISAAQAALRAAARARRAAARREQAETARRRARSYTRVGATLTGFGAVGVVLLATGIGLGRRTDRQLAGLKASKATQGDDWSLPCVDDACRESRREELAPLLARGGASNALVVVGAVAGATLLASGMALSIVGRKHRRAARALELAPTATPTSLGVVLVGRF